MATTSSGSPRYEAHESPSFPASLGYGVQFSLIASATLLVTPVIVASASDIGESYVTWMVFASLVVVGVSTLIQVRRVGPVGAGAILPMFTAAFAIPFCITAVVDGGPATLMTLVIVCAVIQLVISRWLFKSGITTGGIAAVAMILYLELTNPRRMRFQSKLHIDSLPDLNEFIAKFADSRGWGTEMKDKLSAVAEETLLTLAPLDLMSFDLDEDEENEEDEEDERQLIVLAASDGPVADLEFIGGGNQENIEDQVRQLQELEIETPAEHEISLRLLQNYASSVNHHQYSGTDVITLRVEPPGVRQAAD